MKGALRKKATFAKGSFFNEITGEIGGCGFDFKFQGGRIHQ